MMETNTKQIVSEIMERLSHAVPVSASFWSKKEIASCLKVSESTVNKIVLTPGFPAIYRFPASSAGGKKGYPRWAAKEVLAWAEQYRGKEAAL